MFWFPTVSAKRGDQVIALPVGESGLPAVAGHTNYFFYCGMDNTLFKGPTDCALIFAVTPVAVAYSPNRTRCACASSQPSARPSASASKPNQWFVQLTAEGRSRPSSGPGNSPGCGVRRLTRETVHGEARAIAGKAPRHRWHLRQPWQRGICNLQNPKENDRVPRIPLSPPSIFSQIPRKTHTASAKPSS